MSVVVRFLLVSAVLAANLALAQSATKPAPKVYAVLSLVGDKMNVIAGAEQIGSRLDQRTIVPMEVNDATFDKLVITSAAKAIVAKEPKSEIASIDTRSKVLFEKYADLFQVKDDVLQMPAAIRDAVKAQDATHFLLATKSSESMTLSIGASLEGKGEYEGGGKGEGLGFLVDNKMGVIYGSGQQVHGYVHAFVHMKLTMVEFPSGKVIGTQVVRKAGRVHNPSVPTSDPWQAFSSAEKVKTLDRVLSVGVEEAIAKLLK
jgi:hypothetical protein